MRSTAASAQSDCRWATAAAWRLPILTVITLTATAVATGTRLVGPGVLDALRRDPAALRSGEEWRLLSPVLVQSDRSTVVVVAVFAVCAAVGAVGEQLFSRCRWIALYLLGALVGHGIGEVFQPRQGGTSVAFAAILGGLAWHALRPGAHVPRPVRLEAALAVPVALVDTVLRDIHGLPFLTGLLVAQIWHWRDGTRADGRETPAPELS